MEIVHKMACWTVAKILVDNYTVLLDKIYFIKVETDNKEST